MRAFSHALAVDHGFKTGRLITVSVSLDGTSHVSASQQLEYLAETLTRVGRLPEVTRASATQFLPLEATMFMGGPYTVDGQKSKPGVGTDIIPVMSDYFAATSGTILYGRDFTDAEVQSDANVTILNDTFAKLLFVPEHSPKGFPSTLVIHVDRARNGVLR